MKTMVWAPATQRRVSGLGTPVGTSWLIQSRPTSPGTRPSGWPVFAVGLDWREKGSPGKGILLRRKNARSEAQGRLLDGHRRWGRKCQALEKGARPP